MCFLPKRMKFYEVIESRGGEEEERDKGEKGQAADSPQKMKIYVYALVGEEIIFLTISSISNTNVGH